MTRGEFFEICELGDEARTYCWEAAGRINMVVPGIYRGFAAWVDEGAQPGVHLRGEGLGDSTAFRGQHNWFHRPELKGDALRAAVAEARRIAGLRGAGRVGTGLYKPLERALKALGLEGSFHLGGPRPKIYKGEIVLAEALCELCLERTRAWSPTGEAELLASIEALHRVPGVRYERLWPLVNAVPYGTARETREAEAAESAALQSARALLGCQYGPQSAGGYVTKALTRALEAIREREGETAALDFLQRIDFEIMAQEFSFALVAKAKGEPLRVDRVRWRGADAKGFPAWWLVQIGSDHGLLGKLGRRWAFHRADLDSCLAMVPEAHFESALETLSAGATLAWKCAGRDR